jgi:hypothetical protein
MEERKGEDREENERRREEGEEGGSRRGTDSNSRKLFSNLEIPARPIHLQKKSRTISPARDPFF